MSPFQPCAFDSPRHRSAPRVQVQRQAEGQAALAAQQPCPQPTAASARHRLTLQVVTHLASPVPTKLGHLLPEERAQTVAGTSCYLGKGPALCKHPCQHGDLPAPRAPSLRQESALATGTGRGGPRRTQYLLSLRLTPGLRNAGSPPAWLPWEVIVCGGTRGHPLSAALFIFSIFVEGNESRGGGHGAKDGPGGLADRASDEGQRVREASQHFPTTPHTPLPPCLVLSGLPPPTTALLDWERCCGSPLLCLLPRLGHLLGRSRTHWSKPLPTQKATSG